MRTTTNSQNLSAAIIMVMMFLLADLFVPSAFPAAEHLEEEQTVLHVTSTLNPTNDTYIDSDFPNSDYSSDDTGLLGVSGSSDSRILISFPLNYASTDTIHSSRVDLVCSSSDATEGLAVYPATTSASWNDSATWNSRDGVLAWAQPGVDGSSDRGGWEPFHLTAPLNLGGGSSTVELNVTALTQVAVASGQSSLDLVISAHEAQYDCALNETLNTANRPVMIVDSSTTTAGSGGQMTPDFVSDGGPLMTGDFILSADLAPSMTWNTYSGILAEVQVSLDSSFKSTSDDYAWLYNSDIQSSLFTLSGTTGSLAIPSSDGFQNGTYMHYRMRSMDSTGILGSWETGSFFLPEHDVIDNGDGTATVAIDVDDLSSELSFIQDAVADENSKNTNYGSSATLEAQLSSNKETIPHFRLVFDALGMHSNATILDASLNLTRSTSSGSATLALHEMDNDGSWDENELTWLRKKTNQLWRDGGRGLLGYTSDTGVLGSQISDDFSFDLTSELQQHLDDGNTGVIDFAITTRSENGDYS
ncbi:MAG: DNRLRE domain-containing protein, partial [Euryarchaeota archaeon]|nr:DNRLRE domain-containing protein [Euryarchaeota archaeon]